MFGCPRMFGQPHMFGHPPVGLDASLYVWALPMLGCPHMFGHLHIFGCTPCMFGCPNVWITHVSLDTPIFGCLLYVWKMFGCLLYVYNKKSMLCQTEGVSICPHTFGCPLYVWTPSYVWMSLKILDAPYIWGASKHMEDIQTYMGCPNMRGASDHTEGCPNIGGTQTYRGNPNIWGSANIWGCPNVTLALQC